MTITNTLKKNLGVIRVNADHKTQKVQLYYDQEKLNPLKIKEIMKEIGFPVASIKE